MIRALETLENIAFSQEVDGAVISEGNATLVKLMADDESSTVLVNGCLFLNVSSFRHLTFATGEDGACVFSLFGDGMTLTLTPCGEAEPRTPAPQTMRLLEETAFDPDAFVMLEEEDDDE
jgi:hypothetical protein